MNELNQPPKPDAQKAAKAFKVEKQPKKKQEVKKKETKPKKVVRTARAAPMPNISSAMSGLSFDLPNFQNDDLLGADKLLSGAEGSKKLVMTGDSVDTLPRPRTRKAPEYPAKARERGIEGLVVLRIKVSERGQVEQVRVIESEPKGVFDMVAIAAVNDWTFDPARYQGQAVAVSVSQRIPFRLN
jgi:protein TonB